MTGPNDGTRADRDAVNGPSESSFPLVMARDGERVRIVALRAGRGLDRRLVEMGLAIGMEVQILQRQSDGPLLLAVRDMRLGLGRGMAHKILVVPIGGTRE